MTRLSGGAANAPSQKQTAATAIIRNILAGIAISHVRFEEAPQQPRQMLLILRSSAAFSLLSGSFGSLRFFSLGTSLARGWR